MNNQEAKLILGACRPRGQDAADPRAQAALEQAGRDPELAAWYAREGRLDASLGGKLREQCRPPAELKATLLAATRLARPIPWFRQPVWITTLAAMLVGAVVLFALVITGRSGADYAVFRSGMAEILGSKEFRLDHTTPSAAEARQWLAERSVDFELPSGLENKRTLGCRVLDWQGHQVSLVCFKLDGGETVHLFTIDRAALRDAPPGQPQFAETGRYAVAGWSGGGKVYLLACSNGEEILKKVL